MNEIDPLKTAYNERAKQSLRTDLRNKSWKQKVEAIRRMNAASKIARAAMRQALTKIAAPC